MTARRIEAAVTALLDALDVPGDDPELVGTPARVAQLWLDNLTAGYAADPAEILADRIPDTSGVVVTVTDVPFHGICPHHLLPYTGRVHLAYEPAGSIVGFGQLERLVHALSRRLVLQERLTRGLCDAVTSHLDARGVACAIDAEHLCMTLRGREPRSSRVHTRWATGTLRRCAHVLPAVRAQ